MYFPFLLAPYSSTVVLFFEFSAHAVRVGGWLSYYLGGVSSVHLKLAIECIIIPDIGALVDSFKFMV